MSGAVEIITICAFNSRLGIAKALTIIAIPMRMLWRQRMLIHSLETL